MVAADRLLAARGPEDVGLADVAREVGVTTAS
ncbi:TetR family transcriptional regulator [Nannocystis pusilla]